MLCLSWVFQKISLKVRTNALQDKRSSAFLFYCFGNLTICRLTKTESECCCCALIQLHTWERGEYLVKMESNSLTVFDISVCSVMKISLMVQKKSTFSKEIIIFCEYCNACQFIKKVIKSDFQSQFVCYVSSYFSIISFTAYTLRPEGVENMSLGSQVSDLCFWKQNCIRNPKMGSKQSIPVPP